MKTAHERQEEKKQEKLALMKQQVKAGTLVVRKMTPKERSSSRRRGPPSADAASSSSAPARLVYSVARQVFPLPYARIPREGWEGRGHMTVELFVTTKGESTCVALLGEFDVEGVEELRSRLEHHEQNQSQYST